MEFRIGQGYDVHRLEHGLPMVLGGDPFAIYLAEPASDIIASVTTLTIFLLFYKRTLNRPAA